MGKPIEQKVVELLLSKNLTVATAESCTGGLIAGTLINVDGVSAAFNEGFVTYANEAKMKYLGVSDKTLKKHGAVSKQTAREMALGLHEHTGADVCIVSTGIAGPGGGTKEKPVGLVYVGLYYDGEVFVKKNIFEGDRLTVRLSAVGAALKLTKKKLKR